MMMSTYESPGATRATPPPHIWALSSGQGISARDLGSSVKLGKFGSFPHMQSPARFSDSLKPSSAHTVAQLDALPAASASTGTSEFPEKGLLIPDPEAGLTR